MPIEHDAIGERPSGGPCVRMTTFEGPPDSARRVLELMANHVLPIQRRQPGWQGLIGLASPDGQRAVSISFWDSESDLRESAASAGDFRSKARAAGISFTELERLEIVFHETPGTP